MDLAGARRTSEEACARLCRDLNQVKGKLRKAEAETRDLTLQLNDVGKSDGNICKMPSAVQSLVFSDGYDQGQNILTKNSSHSFEKDVLRAEDILPEIVAVTVKSPAISCCADVPASNGVAKPQIATSHHTPPADPTGTRLDDSVDEDECVDYDDYSDYDEEYSETDVALLQRSLSHVSDDNFELGRDVMGALIANAFKGEHVSSVVSQLSRGYSNCQPTSSCKVSYVMREWRQT